MKRAAQPNVVVLSPIFTSPHEQRYFAGPGHEGIMEGMSNLVGGSSCRVCPAGKPAAGWVFPKMDMGGDPGGLRLAEVRIAAQGGCIIPYFGTLPGGSNDHGDCVSIFEDLHWMDPLSLSLLSSLILLEIPRLLFL